MEGTDLSLADQLAALSQQIDSKALICPYCGSGSKFRKTSLGVYRKNYGPAYVCARYPECDSVVGTHNGGDQPKGRLAQPPLRELKKQAHGLFDALWMAKQEREGISKSKARVAAYHWLAQELGIRTGHCHIGWFDEATCKRVIDICRPYAERLKGAA